MPDASSARSRSDLAREAAQRRRARRDGGGSTPETVGTPGNVRRAGLVMLIALGMAAIFNSAEMRSVARDLPWHPFAEETVALADAWHEAMLAAGPAHLRPAVHQAFARLRAVRW